MKLNKGKLLFIIFLSGFTPLLAVRQTVVRIQPDTTSVLRNPLSGWVMYLGRSWDENFWLREGYDAMPADGGETTVSVSDYASTCYIRTGWSSLEPEEGHYAWNDPESRIMRLLNSCLKRGMRLAFRIVVDSRDQGQNTPLYVKEAGAHGFADPRNPKNWSPYPDDRVFQEKYTKFIRAFAQTFNDPDKVDFIDAYGLGKWGEAHAVKYQNYSNKERVFDWITDLYASTFTRIPLVINYHRLVGDTVSWAAPNQDSKRLLETAIRKGYSIRHDAFGMTGYYEDWEKEFARKWQFCRPVIMEGGWITGGQHRYWIDPSGAYREGHSEDVRRGEFEISREAHVNMMDFRVGDEIHSWFDSAYDLVKAFVRKGGYRLYPMTVTFDGKAWKGGELKVEHTWRNIGWGYCPTNIPQWHQKYKVCLALKNHKGNIISKTVVKESDLSKWVKGHDAIYVSRISLTEVPKGNYSLLIGLVDTTKNNTPGLQMAVPENVQDHGWMVVGKVKVK
jgi:hypothetical protein